MFRAKGLFENYEESCGEGFWPQARRRGPSIPAAGCIEGRCVKHGLFLSVCQEYILDTTTPDTHFHQCLQAFRVLKIYVTVTCTLSASCATMQKQSQNYEGRTKKAECYRLKAELRIMNSICENLCRSAAMIWTTERFGPGLISLESPPEFRVFQAVSIQTKKKKKRTLKSPISNFRFSCSACRTAVWWSGVCYGHVFSPKALPGMPGILTFLGYRAFDRFLVWNLLPCKPFQPKQTNGFLGFPENFSGGGIPGGGPKNPNLNPSQRYLKFGRRGAPPSREGRAPRAPEYLRDNLTTFSRLESNPSSTHARQMGDNRFDIWPKIWFHSNPVAVRHTRSQSHYSGVPAGRALSNSGNDGVSRES